MNALRIAASIAMLSVALPTFADSVSTSMSVSVQVVARAVVDVESQPAAVNVTAADIERGYVDVTQPIVVRVRTNSRSGYLLQAGNITGGAFSRIALNGETVSLTVSSHETWLQRPYAAGGDVLSLRARLYLDPAVAPGQHPLPLAFTASAL